MKTKLLLTLLMFVFIIDANISFSQWSNNPQANTTVCDFQNAQTFPKVATTSDGGCFISWFDNRTDGKYKVYLQRLNAQGVKQFATDGLLISDKPQNSYFGDYDMKVDGSDNAIIVFSDKRNAPTDTILNPFAYKISSSGQFLWGPDGVSVSANSAAYQVWPKTAVLSDGSVIVVWWYINTAQRNTWITMQKLNSAGVTQFASPINIQDPGNKCYSYPDVVASDNGSYILSWVYGPKDTVGSFIPDNITIFTNKCDANGNLLWGPQHKIVYTQNGNHVPIYSVPKIYSDGNNGALYSYFTTEGMTIYSWANRFNSSGVNLFPANGSAGSINNAFIHVEPYLAYMSSTDQTFLFWTEADVSTQDHQAIFGQGFSPTGTRLWGNDGIGFSPIDTSAIFGINCFAKDTNIVVIYLDETYSNPRSTLKGFRVGRSGVHSWNTSPILSNANSSKIYLNAKMNQNGMTVAAWLDNRNTSMIGRGGIFAQNLNYNGSIGPVGISQISDLIPESFALHQNYPNPFNNSTLIEFDIRNSGNFKIEIFDMLGKKVDEVVNKFLPTGSYKVNYSADKLSSGVYLYKLSSAKVDLVKKFILVK